MKRFTRLHLLALAVMFLFAGTAFAFQVVDTLNTTPQVTPRMDLQAAFLTLAGIASLVTLLTESVTKFLSSAAKFVLNGWRARAVSFLIAGVLTAIGVSGQIGLFDNVVFQKYALWQVSIGGGIIIGLLANGIFTVDVVQALLAYFKLRVPVEEPPK